MFTIRIFYCAPTIVVGLVMFKPIRNIMIHDPHISIAVEFHTCRWSRLHRCCSSDWEPFLGYLRDLLHLAAFSSHAAVSMRFRIIFHKIAREEQGAMTPCDRAHGLIIWGCCWAHPSSSVMLEQKPLQVRHANYMLLILLVTMTINQCFVSQQSWPLDGCAVQVP